MTYRLPNSRKIKFATEPEIVRLACPWADGEWQGRWARRDGVQASPVWNAGRYSYALRLHAVGMIKSSPQKFIAQGTDWRFLNELKRELKG